MKGKLRGFFKEDRLCNGGLSSTGRPGCDYELEKRGMRRNAVVGVKRRSDAADGEWDRGGVCCTLSFSTVVQRDGLASTSRRQRGAVWWMSDMRNSFVLDQVDMHGALISPTNGLRV
jgi:hypothetical protein